MNNIQLWQGRGFPRPLNPDIYIFLQPNVWVTFPMSEIDVYMDSSYIDLLNVVVFNSQEHETGVPPGFVMTQPHATLLSLYYYVDEDDAEVVVIKRELGQGRGANLNDEEIDILDAAYFIKSRQEGKGMLDLRTVVSAYKDSARRRLKRFRSALITRWPPPTEGV